MTALTMLLVAFGFILVRIRAWLGQQRAGERDVLPFEVCHAERVLDWWATAHFTVTFLVPAWNATEDVEAFIASFNQLGLPKKQLVMCVGGADGSFDVAQKYDGGNILIVEQTPGMGKQRALRESYPYATGNLIYFTDVDCRLEDQVVFAMLSHLHDCRLDVVTGPIQPLRTQVFNSFVAAQWSVERVMAIRQGDTSRGVRGNNAVVTAAALDTSNALHRDVFSGTDYTMAKELIRAGYSIGYHPAAEMPSEYPSRFIIYVRKQARWLRNVLLLGMRYREVGETRAVIFTLLQPFAYLAAAILGFTLPAFWVLAVALLLHSVLNRLSYGRESGIHVTLAGTVKHILGDLSAALIVVYQLLRRRFTW